MEENGVALLIDTFFEEDLIMLFFKTNVFTCRGPPIDYFSRPRLVS